MIIEDKKEDMVKYRDLVEYAAQFVLGDSIQKLRQSRDVEERKNLHLEDLEIAKELGLETPQIDTKPTSGLTGDYDGFGGMALGQDPIAVLQQLGREHQQTVSEDLLNFDLDINNEIDTIVVIRPDATQSKPTIQQK